MGNTSATPHAGDILQFMKLQPRINTDEHGFCSDGFPLAFFSKGQRWERELPKQIRMTFRSSSVI
jgi:hypothetical protein